jgi:hypothetical protein
MFEENKTDHFPFARMRAFHTICKKQKKNEGMLLQLSSLFQTLASSKNTPLPRIYNILRRNKKCDHRNSSIKKLI